MEKEVEIDQKSGFFGTRRLERGDVLGTDRRHLVGKRAVDSSPSAYGHVVRALLPCVPLEQLAPRTSNHLAPCCA